MSKKSNNQIVLNVIEALITIVLGILIAVVGIGQTVDIYFGVLALVLGVSAIGLALYFLAKENVLPFGMTIVGGALIAVGCGLFANFISFAVIVNILILVVLGGGAALIAYGIYFFIKKNKVIGLIQMLIGAAVVTLTAVYINVPDFQKAFWIIVGVLIALYGAFSLVYALVNKK